MKYSNYVFRLAALLSCLTVACFSTGCTSLSLPSYGAALKEDAKASASMPRPSQLATPNAAQNEAYQPSEAYRPGELEALRRDYQSRTTGFGGFGASDNCGFG